VNLKHLTVTQYKRAILDERARIKYRLPLMDAIQGKGIKMAFGIAHNFGTNDCLKNAPLVVEDIDSVNLWRREVSKLDRRTTANAGALKAVLNHCYIAHLRESEEASSRRVCPVVGGVAGSPLSGGRSRDFARKSRETREMRETRETRELTEENERYIAAFEKLRQERRKKPNTKYQVKTRHGTLSISYATIEMVYKELKKAQRAKY